MNDIYEESDPGPDELDSDLMDDGTDIVRCPSCGEEIDAEADRCPYCGHYVIQPITERRFSWWWIALVGLGVLGFILLYAL